MTVCASRVSERLLQEIERTDDGRSSIADIWRRVGATAERNGVPRPSYERVRTLVHAHRRSTRAPTTAAVVVDVVMRARPLEALLDHQAGTDAA